MVKASLDIATRNHAPSRPLTRMGKPQKGLHGAFIDATLAFRESEQGAARDGVLARIRALGEQGLDVNVRGNMGRLPLHSSIYTAFKANDLSLIYTLVEDLKADIHAINDENAGVLHFIPPFLRNDTDWWGPADRPHNGINPLAITLADYFLQRGVNPAGRTIRGDLACIIEAMAPDRPTLKGLVPN